MPFMDMTYIFLILTSLFLTAKAFSQDDYCRRKTDSYTREAEYYQKKADEYRREVEYYLKKAEGYQREASYYTKKGKIDNARMYGKAPRA